MLCRQHLTVPAIGICSSCGAGICATCAVHGEGGKWVCGERCREISMRELSAVNEILKTSRVGLSSTWMLMVFAGILFFSAGIYAFAYQPRFGLPDVFAIFSGVLLVGTGVLMRWRSRAAA